MTFNNKVKRFPWSATTLVLILVLVILASSGVHSKNPYIFQGSIGDGDHQVSVASDADLYLPISEWVGEKFLFLPENPTFATSYYPITPGVIYEDVIGSVATITGVSRTEITFKIEGTGATHWGVILPGKGIRYLGPYKDLVVARELYVGKDLYYKMSTLAFYNSPENIIGSFDTQRYGLVSVEDVVLGWSHNRPLRFIVRNSSGQVGFADVALSNTNVDNQYLDVFKFDNYFMLEDPRSLYEWPHDIWDLIERSRIMRGMTPEQVRLSWGGPDSVNPSHGSYGSNEQWIYRRSNGNDYLYFREGVLDSWSLSR